MLKRKNIKKIVISLTCLIITFLLYLFPKSDDVFIPNTKYNTTALTNAIYPINDFGYISRIKVPLKEKSAQGKIREIVEYLTVGTSKSELLPDGFSPIIPNNIVLLKEKIEKNNLQVYFNDNFNNLDSYTFEKVLESLIYSLTSLNGIDNISIYVNNKVLTEYTNSSTPLNQYLDKSFGINKKYDISSIRDTTKTTIFYTAKNDSTNYFVPITKITNDTIPKVEIIIKELTSKPVYETSLMSYLNAETTLNNYELLDKEINLEFNNAILSGINNKNDLEEVTYAINLSIKSNYDVDYVSYIVENKKIATFDIKDLEN